MAHTLRFEPYHQRLLVFCTCRDEVVADYWASGVPADRVLHAIREHLESGDRCFHEMTYDLMSASGSRVRMCAACGYREPTWVDED